MSLSNILTNIVLHKGASIEDEQGKKIITSNSTYPSSGFFYKIKTQNNITYTLLIDAILKEGDKAFVFCENLKRKKLIDRNNMIVKERIKYKFSIDGDGSIITLGILFCNSHQRYVLDLYKFELEPNTTIIYPPKEKTIIDKAILPKKNFKPIKLSAFVRKSDDMKIVGKDTIKKNVIKNIPSDIDVKLNPTQIKELIIVNKNTSGRVTTKTLIENETSNKPTVTEQLNISIIRGNPKTEEDRTTIEIKTPNKKLPYTKAYVKPIKEAVVIQKNKPISTLQSTNSEPTINIDIIPYIITTPNPKVSIILTVYNKESTVKNAILSILNQTYNKIELIIVDDNSTDQSPLIINEFKDVENVKIITNPENFGCYGARNIGIKASSGDIIGIQDADDISLSNRIEKQVLTMHEKQVPFCGTRMLRTHLTEINELNDIEIMDKAYELRKQHFNGHYYLQCCHEIFGYATLLMTRNIFEVIGLFREDMKFGADMEFGERYIYHTIGKIFKQDEDSWMLYHSNIIPYIYYRIDEVLYLSMEMTPDNITRKYANEKKDFYLLKQKWRDEYQKPHIINI